MLTDEIGEITDRYDYDAYGVALNFDPSGAATTLLYAGEQFEASLGHYYLRARYYDPTTGRFNRLDPFDGDTLDPLSLHKYAYVHGDPINKIDPSGKFFTIGGVMAAVGIIATITTIGVIAYDVYQVAYGIQTLVVLTEIAAMIAESPIDPVEKVILGNQLARFAVVTIGQIGSDLGSLAELVIFQVAAVAIIKAVVLGVQSGRAAYVSSRAGRTASETFSAPLNDADRALQSLETIKKSSAAIAKRFPGSAVSHFNDFSLVSAPGQVTLVAHGSKLRELPISDIAMAISGAPHYSGTARVTLVACSCAHLASGIKAALGGGNRILAFKEPVIVGLTGGFEGFTVATRQIVRDGGLERVEDLTRAVEFVFR